MLSKTLPKDISRSVFKHLVNTITIVPHIFIEGEKRNTSDFPRFIEIRLDGPWFSAGSKDSWMVEYEMNILIQAPASENLYDIEDICGDVYTELEKSINILDDMDVLIACSSLKTNFRQKLQINRFGQIEPTVPVLQATIEARHEFTIEV